MDAKGKDPRVAGIAANCLDALRAMRNGCAKREDNPRAQHIARAMLDRRDPRQFGCEHLAVLFVDAIDRDCPREVVMGLVRELEAEVGYLCDMRDGVEPEPLPEAHVTEEHCEGAVDELQAMFAHDPSPRTYNLLDDAVATHKTAYDRFLHSARQRAMSGIQS